MVRVGASDGGGDEEEELTQEEKRRKEQVVEEEQEVATQTKEQDPLGGQEPTGKVIEETDTSEQTGAQSGGTGTQRQVEQIQERDQFQATPSAPERLTAQDLRDKGISGQEIDEIQEDLASQDPGLQEDEVIFTRDRQGIRARGEAGFRDQEEFEQAQRRARRRVAPDEEQAIQAAKRATPGEGIGRTPGGPSAEDLQAQEAIRSQSVEASQIQQAKGVTPGAGLGLTPGEVQRRQRLEQAEERAGEQLVSALEEQIPGEEFSVAGFERGEEFEVRRRQADPIGRLSEAITSGELLRRGPEAVGRSLARETEAAATGTPIIETELTPTGRRRFTTQRLLAQGKTRGQQKSITAPGFGEIEAELGSKEVKTAAQLEFGEEGQLVDVGDAPAVLNVGRGTPAEQLAKGTIATLDVGAETVSAVGEGIGDVGAGVVDLTTAIPSPTNPLGAFAPQETKEFSTEFQKGVIRGGTDLFEIPEVGLEAVRVGTESTIFTGEAISEEGVVEGLETAGKAGAAVGTGLAAKATVGAAQQPTRTAGTLLGGAAVGTALSPIRVSKLDVPLKEGGTTTLRGVRVTAPKILETKLDIPGTTIAGTRGLRPTKGTPSVSPSRIDFERFGERVGAREPVGRFETDVIRQMTQEAGETPATRFRASEQLIARGAGDIDVSTPDVTGRFKRVVEPALDIGERVGMRAGEVVGRAQQRIEPALSAGERAGFVAGMGLERSLRLGEAAGRRAGLAVARGERIAEPAFQAGERAGFVAGEQAGRTTARIGERLPRPSRPGFVDRPVEIAQDIQARVGERVEAVTPDRASSQLEASRTEEILTEAEDVPEGLEPELAEALRDIDAEIFGSAAVKAQLPGARTPRDIDIAVPDTGVARRRLSEAFTEAGEPELARRIVDPSETDPVFDIKSFEEKARPGEIVKFGRLAQERLETEGGVKVAPAGEELIKKAGASAFLRGEGTPGPKQLGETERVDVGPEPVGEGKFVRAKDPADASVIATSRITERPLSPLSRRRARSQASEIEEFRAEFEAELERATAEQPTIPRPEPVVSRRRLSRLAREERAELQLPGRKIETDRPRDTDVEPRDIETDSSIGRRGEFDPEVPLTVASPSIEAESPARELPPSSPSTITRPTDEGVSPVSTEEEPSPVSPTTTDKEVSTVGGGGGGQSNVTTDQPDSTVTTSNIPGGPSVTGLGTPATSVSITTTTTTVPGDVPTPIPRIPQTTPPTEPRPPLGTKSDDRRFAFGVRDEFEKIFATPVTSATGVLESEFADVAEPGLERRVTKGEPSPEGFVQGDVPESLERNLGL